jgi:hypothetical protein
MTKGKIAAMTIGVAGAIVLGAFAVPALMHRDTTPAEPTVAIEPAPADTPAPIAKAPRAKVAAKSDWVATNERTIAPEVVPSLPATEPELHARLKPVLNEGTRMTDAAAGFRDAEQFATVAHAARNTNVPFVVLKHRVLEEKQTLAQAIRASRPDVDANHEVARAHDAARFDIAVITS